MSGGPRGWAPPRSSSLRGRAGAARGNGAPRPSPGVGPPSLHSASRGVSCDVTARPQPPSALAPSPRRLRRPSLSPRDKPAGGWGSGSARSQPARREGRGAGRAGGAQPVTRRGRHSAQRSPGAAASRRSGTRAHAGPPPVTRER